MLIFVSGSNVSVSLSVHLPSQPSSVAIYLNKSKKLLYDFDWLHILFDIYIYFYTENTNDDFIIIAQSGIMEVLILNFICLKTIQQVLLKSGRLALVCMMVSRVENQFTTTYSRMQPASKRLESMLQEHYSRIHPESKAIKLKSKFCRKRKTTL